MGPQIAIYDASHSQLVNTWDVGTLKAQKPSEVLTINIWNNKGGVTAVSDLKECYLMVLDSVGDTANDDVARDKWVQVNIPSIDGNSDVWKPIGGTHGKDVRANSGMTENTISGMPNDGIAANSLENHCTIHLRVVAPPNSTPKDHYYKIRLVGYFT